MNAPTSPLLPRLTTLLALLLLAACEADISLDLSGTPPEDVNRAVLRITAVELLREDGGSETIRLSTAREVDFVDLARGQVQTLLSGEEVATGRYSGARLQIDAQSQTLDSFLESSDGGEHSLILSAGAQLSASADFSLRDGDSTALTLHLDLRSSLLPGSNAAGDRLLSPRLRLVQSSGSIAGDVASALFEAGGCNGDNAPQAGEVVYAFTGANVIADELDGLAPEPVSTALISRDASTADYVLAFLPAGDYTLAVSCVADLDDPAADDGLSFIATANASVSAGSTTTLNFEADSSR